MIELVEGPSGSWTIRDPIERLLLHGAAVSQTAQITEQKTAKWNISEAMFSPIRLSLNILTVRPGIPMTLGNYPCVSRDFRDIFSRNHTIW
jgi:hypothetical protein